MKEERLEVRSIDESQMCGSHASSVVYICWVFAVDTCYLLFCYV